MKNTGSLTGGWCFVSIRHYWVLSSNELGYRYVAGDGGSNPFSSPESL